MLSIEAGRLTTFKQQREGQAASVAIPSNTSQLTFHTPQFPHLQYGDRTVPDLEGFCND